MRRSVLTVALILAITCTSAWAADAPAPAGSRPRLVNETILAVDNDSGTLTRDSYGLRLSPNGNHLLYIRSKPAQLPAADGAAAKQVKARTLILRDLKAGKEVAVPIPAYLWDDIPRMLLSENPFSPDGKKLVLGAGVDTNGDGLYDHRKENMEALVYDIASQHTTKLGVANQGVLPAFDSTGKRVIVNTWNKRTGQRSFLSVGLKGKNVRYYSPVGAAVSPCPTANVMPVMTWSDDKTKLLLHDLDTDKTLATPAVHEKNTSLDDHKPQWTPDGRYLFYIDLKVDAAGKRGRMTRIWDRVDNKEIGILDGLIPLGPGPGAASMVLQDRSRSSLKLYDAERGKSWPLATGRMRVAVVQGRYLLYTATVDGKTTAYRAQILPPKGMKGTLTPKKAPPPTKIRVGPDAIKRR